MDDGEKCKITAVTVIVLLLVRQTSSAFLQPGNQDNATGKEVTGTLIC